MDVNETWRLLAEAVEADDWNAAEEHANDLKEWIERGESMRIGKAAARPQGVVWAMGRLY